MSNRSRLFSYKDTYDTIGSNKLFLQAMKDNCLFQYNRCPEYRKILDSEGFHPSMLEKYGDIEKIPFLPTLLFKRHRLFSVPKGRMLFRSTSSGTSGKVSEVGFTAGDLMCGLKMVLKVCRARKLMSIVPAHCVVFGYKPRIGNKLGIAKTAFGITLFTPALSRTYALKYKDGKYVPDLEGVLKSIQKHSRSRFPMRLIGLPAYTYFLMKMMEDRGIRVQLAKGSKIMLGGGWKQFYAQQADKPEFYALAQKVLGIGEDSIIEFFGAVEQPVFYCDCPNHHFHVPVFGRVIIRDPVTLKPVPNGTAGLVNLLTPMVKAVPILSVMTDDLGILHDGEQCGCGLTSPYLEILGRVGLSGIKTCAAGAAEILEKVTFEK